MNKNTFIKLGVGIVLFIIMIYSFSGGQTTEEYIAEIEKERDERDIFMRNSPDSPFKGKEEKYQRLKFYPIDARWKVKARFYEIPTKNIRRLPTSDNKIKEYFEYGSAEFSIADKPQQLLLLKNANDQSLFLAFGDETGAIETYGAGRYLEVTHDGSNTITLDFNRAYNPYCAYAHEYSCPLPPRENLLSVPIEAGEKTYK